MTSSLPPAVPKLLGAAGACLVAGAVMSYFAAQHDRWAGDLPLLEAIQELPGWLEPGADAVRSVTDTQAVLIVGALVAGGLWQAGRRAMALGLLVALAMLPLLQGGVKELVDRPRPDPALVDYRGSFTSPSFPSGHVMSGTVLYAWVVYVIARSERSRARVLAIPLAVLVVVNGFANIYVGVHWPSDVLGGYVGAGVILFATIALQHWLRERFPEWLGDRSRRNVEPEVPGTR